MNRLQISLFGNLRCVYADQPIVLEARKAQELLCFLLLHRDQLHEREKLADLLWLEKSVAQSRKYLRQALWQLQAALHTCADQPELLCTGYQQIGINPAAALWLDVTVFEEAFQAVDKHTGHSLSSAQVQLLQGAIPLYTADLLEGWYYDWCIYERERFQNMYLTMLDKLSEYLETHEQYESALNHSNAILKYDRARERTHRQLMRLYYWAGNRTAALHQYEACVSALAEELGVEPAKSTVTLYEQIRTDQLVKPPLTNGAAPVLRTKSTIHPDALSELKQIRLTLYELQSQVSDLIYHFEQR